MSNQISSTASRPDLDKQTWVGNSVLERAGGPSQRLHAALILVLPTLSVIVAGIEIWNKVRIWEPILAASFYFLTILGITAGFHRLFAHRAFQAHNVVRATLAILGSMAAQGPPIYWVSNHRRHHRFGDDFGDPHSPHRWEREKIKGWAGFWHAHTGWTFTHKLTNSAFFSKDLLRDRLVSWINRYYFEWVLLGLAIPAAIGFAIERGWWGAWHGLLWGGGVRLFFSYHVAASINSITHMFGYRSFATNEESRNNIWLGLPSLGEGWHNNHHAYASSAIFGFRWWEVDLGGLAIRALERLGLAWNVRRPKRDVLNKFRSRISPGESVWQNEVDGETP